MSQLPRVAVGTIQPGIQRQTVLSALLEVLRRDELQVQTFHSRACFANYRMAAAVTGLNPRHLDSWLMSEEICREVFVHGAMPADLAVVDGEFSEAAAGNSAGGSLDTLCRWLDLARVVVLDASQWDGFASLARPEQVDAVLLDRVADEAHLARLKADVEARWGAPVLGALEELPELRSAVERMPAGVEAPREWYVELGTRFGRHWNPRAFAKLAARSPLAPVAEQWFGGSTAALRPTVALAYDEAFNCYFPDTLDLLELRGAEVVDFSPLADESLPPGVDIVYVGCGHPEQYADALSENHCMKAALRSHLCQGRRIYAEGGGLAYLCQQMETPEGELQRMVGLISAAARLTGEPYAPPPVEVTLDRANWLGRRGATLRGYRNNHWRLEPIGALASFAACAEQPYDLVGTFPLVGSLLHLHFAPQAETLGGFFEPHRTDYCDCADLWSMSSCECRDLREAESRGEAQSRGETEEE